AEQFRYLRVPIDHEGGMGDFLRMRVALGSPGLRARAVRRCARAAVAGARPELVEQLELSASRALALFAGDHEPLPGRPRGGLIAVSDFMEANVPLAERERAGEVLIRILNGALFELVQLTR
ncbi:hypothetical protein, partial [Leclercia adecarboxylata]|uniref:hypothetical protein n=1 Tax=Leclercia adecarboxylata TaxID=83655 RepID=UPI00234C4550